MTERRRRAMVAADLSRWQPPGTLWERPPASAHRAYFNRVLWSFIWRSMLMAAVFLAAFGFAFAPPPVAVAGFVVAGLALGLWHRRRGGLGPVWRSLALVGATAYVGPSFPSLFPVALGSVVGLNVLAPWLAARR